MRRHRLHPGQLEIDFSIPAKDPLSVSECAAALKVSNAVIYEAVQEGRMGAITIHRVESDREHFRIPLQNFVCFLNQRYGDALYFTFPESHQLTVVRCAKALGCTDRHVLNLIADNEFPRAFNQGRKGKKKHWVIPIVDLVAYVNRNRVGSYC